VSSALKAVYPDGGRDFPPDTRAGVYTWLGQRLSARAGIRDLGN
jgi:hypothetical protein